MMVMWMILRRRFYRQSGSVDRLKKLARPHVRLPNKRRTGKRILVNSLMHMIKSCHCALHRAERSDERQQSNLLATLEIASSFTIVRSSQGQDLHFGEKVC